MTAELGVTPEKYALSILRRHRDAMSRPDFQNIADDAALSAREVEALWEQLLAGRTPKPDYRAPGRVTPPQTLDRPRVAPAPSPPGQNADPRPEGRRPVTRGGYGQRSDVTVIGAPLLNAGGDFDDPACARRLDLSEAWDMPPTGTVRGPHPNMVREALAVCSGCRHLIDCGQHALEAGERVGIWGGLTPDQRAALRQIAGKA